MVAATATVGAAGTVEVVATVAERVEEEECTMRRRLPKRMYAHQYRSLSRRNRQPVELNVASGRPEKELHSCGCLSVGKDGWICGD